MADKQPVVRKCRAGLRHHLVPVGIRRRARCSADLFPPATPAPAYTHWYTLPFLAAQEGCEFLVAESADGRLDLSDMYVTTDAPTRVGFVVGDNPWGDEAEAAGSTGGPGSVIDVSPEQSYRRPEGLEELQPPAPREYHAVPWTSYWSGDTVKEKAAKAWVRWQCGPACWAASGCRSTQPLGPMLSARACCWTCYRRSLLLLPLPARTSRAYLLQVWRYYLVPVATREPELRLDFDSELFMLDARSATVRRCEVRGSSGRRL